VPLDCAGERSSLGVRDAFVVPQGGEGFDVAVVSPPACRDDVVIEVGETHDEVFHPATQFRPRHSRFPRCEVFPVKRAAEVVEVGRPVRPEEGGKGGTSLFGRVGVRSRLSSFSHLLLPSAAPDRYE
jgi:hypothetical protein